MQELEKILEEIEQKKCEHIDKDYIFGSGDIVNGLDMAMEIIRKHMNDGWISVEERLPEDDIEVLITYVDVDDEEETWIDITTYGDATLGGNKLDYKEWRNPFPYFKGNYKVTAWKPLPEPYRPERSES